MLSASTKYLIDHPGTGKFNPSSKQDMRKKGKGKVEPPTIWLR